MKVSGARWPGGMGRSVIRWILVTSALFTGTGLSVRSALPPARCLDESASRIVVADRQVERLDQARLPRGAQIDARSARWTGLGPYPVVLEGRAGLCVSGGTITGTWPRDTSWDEMHSAGGLQVSSRGVIVEDFRAHNYGDAIRLVERSQGFVVRRAHITYNRDDCIENDWLHSGIVQDSLLDGCYNAFSARTYDGQEDVDNGSRNVWRIEDSLVRLQPMEGVYKDRGLIPGHGGFFKWDERGPMLSLRGNVFRADQPANTVGLGIPEGKLADCADNTMVWLGEGPFPEPLPDCFTVTTDVRVWDEAVAEWRREHG